MALTAHYVRQLETGRYRCCGPNPRYGYQDEAIAVGIGPERNLPVGRRSLALDL